MCGKREKNQISIETVKHMLGRWDHEDSGAIESWDLRVRIVTWRASFFPNKIQNLVFAFTRDITIREYDFQLQWKENWIDRRSVRWTTPDRFRDDSRYSQSTTLEASCEIYDIQSIKESRSTFCINGVPGVMVLESNCSLLSVPCSSSIFPFFFASKAASSFLYT